MCLDPARRVLGARGGIYCSTEKRIIRVRASGTPRSENTTTPITGGHVHSNERGLPVRTPVDPRRYPAEKQTKTIKGESEGTPSERCVSPALDVTAIV